VQKNWNEIVLTFSKIIETYDFAGTNFVKTLQGSGDILFLSKTFIIENKWKIFPLWEGDLASFIPKKNNNYSMTKIIEKTALKSEDDLLYYAGVERTNWEYHPVASARSRGQRARAGFPRRDVM
jgi:hypothetical protein